MTPEQRIAQLEAELAETRADLRRMTETMRVMVETQVKERAAEAEAKAVRRERNARHHAKTSRQTSIETRAETSQPPAPSSSPPPSFSLPPPSEPSPSFLYPSSPASPPPPPKTTSSAPADLQPAEEDIPDATDEATVLQAPPLQVASKPAESPEDLQALWNAESHPTLPRWQGMSDARRRRAAARLRERPLQAWREVIRRLSASPFCRGEEGGTWRASPDWLLQPDVADKVLEGKYDRPGSAPALGNPGRGSEDESATCAGCGEGVSYAATVGQEGAFVRLGASCGCWRAWQDAGVGFQQAAQWARERRRNAA